MGHAASTDTLLELGFEPWRPAASSSESLRFGADTWRCWSVRPAMGTLVSVAAVNVSGDRAERAIEEAFREMARLVAIFSRHDSGAPVAELNARGRTVAPPELLELLERARRLYLVTRGVFDVTVQPLVDLYRSRRGMPSPRERAEAAALVGLERLSASGCRLSFERSGMGLTLDGIAKGFVVDRMAEVLARHGVDRFLVNAGGDIRARGTNEHGRPWSVGVRDPSRPDEMLEVLTLTEGAVATSGNYERAFEHIVAARDGRLPRECASASVTAPSATAADALATALFVLGPSLGCALADALTRCGGMTVDGRGRRLRSRRWRGMPQGGSHAC